VRILLVPLRLLGACVCVCAGAVMDISDVGLVFAGRLVTTDTYLVAQANSSSLAEEYGTLADKTERPQQHAPADLSSQPSPRSPCRMLEGIQTNCARRLRAEEQKMLEEEAAAADGDDDAADERGGDGGADGGDDGDEDEDDEADRKKGGDKKTGAADKKVAADKKTSGDKPSADGKDKADPFAKGAKPAAVDKKASADSKDGKDGNKPKPADGKKGADAKDSKGKAGSGKPGGGAAANSALVKKKRPLRVIDEKDSLVTRLDEVLQPANDGFVAVTTLCLNQLARCCRELFIPQFKKLFVGEWLTYDAPAEPRKK
jgi:hypothetical protein